jgi:hypothetical protein
MERRREGGDRLMARLQILELPEGSGDDRPPFILVIDEWDIDSLETSSMLTDYWDAFGQKIGARGVLFVDRTIDIPANDTTAYLRGDETARNESDEMQVRAIEGLRLARERTDIARDMDRLAKWKNELADALGMDHTRDWDDIRNAARGLRKDRDAKAEAIECVRTTPTEPEVMNSEQESPHVWMHGYRCGVLAARDALRPRSEPTDA